MCVITRLKSIGRRASRIAVELDGRPWAEINSEVALRKRLTKGMVLDAEARESLLGEDAFVRARRAAVILLKTRPRARVELRRKLKERRFDDTTIDRIEEHFTEKGDLDDALFARKFVSHQFKTKTVGPRKVANMLRQLGVADGYVFAALEEAPAAGEEEQKAAAERFIERRLRRLKSDEPARRRKKLYGALTRAGFEADVFLPLLEAALADEGNEE